MLALMLNFEYGDSGGLMMALRTFGGTSRVLLILFFH